MVPGVSPEPPKVGRISVVLEERVESGTSSKEQILVWIKERLAGCEKEQFSDQHRSGLKWTWSWNVHGHRAYVPCPSVSSHW